MKNVLAILQEMGIEVPEDKRDAVLKEVSTNYKTIAEFDKLQEKAQHASEQLATATDALKKFDGFDPDAARKAAEDLQKKLEEQETRFAAELAERDNNAALERELGEYTFSSKSARDSILSKVRGAGLVFKDGKHLGFAEFMEQMKAEDADAFKAPAAPAAKITEKGTGRTAPAMTREQIVAIKDATERQAAIAANPQLFPVR